jgi:RNA recognition motif-containing protein
MTADEFTAAFKDFGQIYTSITNHIHDRGVAFVTYFDIRSAMTAVEKMQNFESHGRKPITGFAFHNPDANGFNPGDLSLSILIRPLPTSQHLSADLVRQTLNRYGEIQAVTERALNLFVIDFFDLRSARQLVAEADRISIGGVQFTAEPIVESRGPQQFVQFHDPYQQYPQFQYLPPPPPGYVPSPPLPKPAAQPDIGESVRRLRAMLLHKNP